MKTILTILLTALALPAHAVSIVPEPETIFYGKILNRSGPQPYQMTSGSLQWTISRSEGAALAFDAQLFPHANGTYSYRLAVPHSALALDLEVDPDSIPLGAAGTSHRHLAITVDGQPATITSEGGTSFDVEQAARAATYRLDLEVSFVLPDTDGDGMADWWEDLHGLDKQSNDATGDLDGDGRNNLAEFLDGTDPNEDNRIAKLLTTTVAAAGEGTSGILLQTIDADTPPSALLYTLTSAPTTGTLTLRNVRSEPANPDAELSTGATFTQQDLNRGRLVFTPASEGDSPAFSVSVHDRDPEHDPSTGTITIELYNPTNPILESGTPAERVALALDPTPLLDVPAEEQLHLRQFILARDGGYLFWDLRSAQRAVNLAAASNGTAPEAYATDFGPAPNAIITGSAAADNLRGGLAPDWLIGGTGDDTLTGDRGGDRFILLGAGDGSDTITDFDLEEGDALDLSQALQGSSTLLSDYVQATQSGTALVIGLDLNGDRSGFTDLTVTLTDAAGPDLYALWSGGHLLTNGLSLPPRIEITASSEPASENGPTPANFTITLGSPSAVPLTITLLTSGSATNGIDYVSLPTTVTVPVGLTSIELPVTPYQDAITEPAETVHVALQPGSGYEISANTSAEITIADLLPEITVTALVPTAIRDAGTAGLFLIERTAIIDRSVLVRLEIDGTATMGSDYDTITPFVNLAAGDTTALLMVMPKPGATLAFGAESVRLSVSNHASYRVGTPGSAEVLILEQLTSLAAWRATHFPELNGTDLADFTNQDPGSTGFTNLLRYAFLLDPQTPGSLPEASHLPKVRLIDGHLAIEFTRLLGATDLQWIVETSTDLATWTSDPTRVEDISSTLQTTDIRRSLHQLTSPVTAGPESYLRVRVIYQP